MLKDACRCRRWFPFGNLPFFLLGEKEIDSTCVIQLKRDTADWKHLLGPLFCVFGMTAEQFNIACYGKQLANSRGQELMVGESLRAPLLEKILVPNRRAPWVSLEILISEIHVIQPIRVPDTK